ncbi:pre-rRNA-processing protein esf1 [Cynara cardunculus var. scolymus]|uniref:NUC153-like protein n=1 Tax=Cynara cardunculus var. scolymus TaxID=59895 RepID=A0A118JUY8_CYNCS|nr:pre-rRNA-processing protein esf1 [Cynara cardunculus var. scolymus]KVH92257.1 NUC153-like protein [Cynara cardunculus var. scolymus]
MGSKNKKNKKAPKETPDANTAAKVAGNRVFGSGNKVITDERFAASQKDPRFQDVPKHKNKVAIDSRFSRMFTDKNFSTSSARVDKRGRAKQDGDSSQDALKHYYRIDNEEKEQKKQPEESDDDDDDDMESDEENKENERKEAEKLKKVREKLSKSKSKSESETESESELESESLGEEEDFKDDWTSTDTDEDDEAYLEEENDALQLEENVPEIDKETHRLAVVNLDWNQVQAVDLFVVLSSFLPKSGQILSVSVYPSEFGLKRMEEEAVRGPVGLFDDEDGKNTKNDDNDDSDDDSEIDNEKLRAYELSRLRYYFAVVVCDSIATADYLYKSCDGIEFERSSNRLDLRFIPDSMEFTHPARDVATGAPANYEGIDFQTRALQLSKIDLTWDENEPQRSKKLKRKINVDQESEYVKDELELKEFLASSESETDEDENDVDGGNKPGKRQKTDAYRALLQSGDGSDEDEDDDGIDMEVTFNTGLEDLSKKILEKKDKKSETVWDAYLRKKKEKKKARKNRSKNSSDDESGGSDDEPVEEPGDFFTEESAPKKKVSGDRRGQETKTGLAGEEAAASRAELELLLADDDGGDANVKGYNLKRKRSKGKKGKQEAIDEGKIPTVDYDDPRFSSLFTRPDFALDPTDPQFKRSAAYARQVVHKQHKGEPEEKGREGNVVGVEADKTDSKKDKHEMSLLLKSIKMKSKQVPLPSDGKKSRRKGK